MMYCNNHNINKLIKSCGGFYDFRDAILLENCKIKEQRAIKNRYYSRHYKRREHNSKRIK